MTKTKAFWDDHTDKISRRNKQWAISDRGWLFAGPEEKSSVGNYLDYGPDHYRSPREYCKPGACDCRQSQPGNIHCVVYGHLGSRYVETVAQAKIWIEEQSGVSTRETAA